MPGSKVETQRAQRYLFDQYLVIQFIDKGDKRLAVCKDISISGVRVGTYGRFPLNRPCSIEILIEPYGLTESFLGMTVRSKKGDAAIEFVNLRDKEKNFLNFVFAHYCKAKETNNQ